MWEKIISEYGVKKSDHIILYDNSDVISSCRVWYSFLYFDHNPDLVSVLDGGLKKWLIEKKETSIDIVKYERSSYKANENDNMTLSKDQILANINKNILLQDMSVYSNCLKVEGKLLLSGFFTTDIEELRNAASNNGLKFVKMQEKNNWAMLMLEKL